MAVVVLNPRSGAAWLLLKLLAGAARELALAESRSTICLVERECLLVV